MADPITDIEDDLAEHDTRWGTGNGRYEQLIKRLVTAAKALRTRVLGLEGRADAAEARLTALEARVTALEPPPP